MINASTGTTLQRIDYDDWGTPTYVTGSVNDQPFAFAGGLWDPDTKLLHLGAREYDPQARRFITRDPSGFSGGWNLYGYAWNDPVNYVDPDGNTPWLAAAAVGAASSAVTEIALQLATNGGNFDCIDWGYVGVSAAIGALPGVGKGLNWRALLAAERGAIGLGPKVVNTKIAHAAERAVERAGFTDTRAASDALRSFGDKIREFGLPSSAIQDAAGHWIVPGLGQGGAAVYRVNKSGKLVLQTVHVWKP